MIIISSPRFLTRAAHLTLGAVVGLGIAMSLAACSGSRIPSPPSPAETEAEVLEVLNEQAAAWNEGSIRSFMDGYAQTDSLVFLSGGSVRKGWEENLYAYRRAYPNAAAMGTLSFTDLTVRPLTPDLALVYGRWRLDRAKDAPSGLFTLLFKDGPSGWRIVHDHTSSAQ